MYTLGPADEILGKAGTAGVINFAVYGVQKTGSNPVVDTYDMLAKGTLTGSVASMYPSPALTQSPVGGIHLRNTSASPVSVQIYQNGSAAGDEVDGFIIPASGSATYGGGQWQIKDASGALVSTVSVSLTGDVTGSGTGTVATTLATVNPNVGAFGSAANSLSVTADAKGRITALSQQAIAIAESQVTNLVTDLGNKQPLDSDLTTIAGLTATTDNFIQSKSSAWSSRTPAQVAADLNPSIVIAESQVTNLVTDLSNKQPLDATLTALAAANWAADALPIGTGADTLTQTTFAANTFPGKSSSGGLVAKSISNAGLAFVAAADVAAETALLNVATTALKGLMSAVDKIKTDGMYKDLVADFGADPTGTTDCTSILQTAVDSFGSTGGRLFVPQGTYKVDLTSPTTITISKPVIIFGAGRSISVFAVNHASRTLFTLATGAAGAGFEQIRISTQGQSNTLRTGGFAVDMAGISNVYMQQCDILFQHQNVRSAGALQFLDDMNIREFGHNASGGSAILIDSTGDRYVRRLTTDNPADEAGAAGIRVRQCSSVVISDCNIINSTNALDIVPNGGGSTAVASILAMNTFFDSSVIGVNILPASSSDTAHRIRFTNCWFGSNSTANVRIGNGTIPNANIASVDFIGCDFFGSSVPFGLDVQGATEWSVRGCRFGGHTTNAIKVGVGTGSSDHNFAITDNLIGFCLGAGANAQGITVGAGTYGRYQIQDNRGLDTNTTKGIVDSGAVGPLAQKNVSDNMGALLKGSLQLGTSGNAAVTTARNVATSGTGETFLFTCRIPGNSVAIGQIFRLTALCQTSTTSTMIARIRLGAAGTIADAAVNIACTSPTSTTTNQWHIITAYVYVVALGSTATVCAVPTGSTAAVTYNAPNAVADAPGNVVTTADWFITFSATASTGTHTVRAASVEAL